MRRTTVIGVDLAVGLKIPPSYKIDVCVIKLIIPPSIKCKSLRHLKNMELLKLKQENLFKENFQPTIIIIYLTFFKITITFKDDSFQFKPFLSLCLRLKIYMIL